MVGQLSLENLSLQWSQVLLLSGAWIVYFIIHSLTASLPAKRWMVRRFPAWMPAYRLLFNLVALATLMLPLALVYSWHGPPVWRWEGVAWWLANGLALLAVMAFFWSLRFYRGDEFLGTRQWRERERRVEDQEHFHISPLHRYVRHPWYSLGLVLLWTREMDAAYLLSVILVTLYFVIGYRLEERKLRIYHGDKYRHYQARVPGLIPLPWRHLSREEARRLLEE